MALIASLYVGFIALSQGAAGQTVAWIVGCAGIGSTIAATVAVVKRWRISRRTGCGYWEAGHPFDAQPYLITGAVIGAVLAVTVLVLELFLLNP